MAQTRQIVLLFVLFTLSACSFSPGCSSHVYDKPHFFINTTQVHDLEVVFVVNYEWQANPEAFRPHVEAAIRAARAYWDGDIDDLDGWTIQLMPQYYTCLGRHFDSSIASGCTNWLTKTMYLYINTAKVPCFEDAELAHELGHVVHPWDYRHTNSKFRDFDQYWQTVRNGATMDQACSAGVHDAGVTQPGMWNHPVGF